MIYQGFLTMLERIDRNIVSHLLGLSKFHAFFISFLCHDFSRYDAGETIRHNICAHLSIYLCFFPSRSLGWELRLPQASKTESELVRSAINNQKITGLCGPMGDHKRPLWTVGAEGRC